MTALKRYWRLLELFRGGTLRVQWQKYLREEYEPTQPFLRDTGELGEWYPHPQYPLETLRVVTHGPDDHVGVCDKTGLRIRLRTEDLIIREIDRPAMEKAITEALGIRYAPLTVLDAPQVTRLGYYSTRSQWGPAALFMIPVCMEELERTVERLLLKSTEKILLLVPSRRLYSPDAENILRERQAIFVPLEETLELENGRFVLSPIGQQMLSHFTHSLPKKQTTGRSAAFSLPPDTNWEKIRIRLVDGHTAAITAGPVHQVLNYAQMGLENRKNNMPSVQWELLRAFALGGGVLTWKSPQADRCNQKRRENLAKTLKQFFGLKEDPFESTNGGWRARFVVTADV